MINKELLQVLKHMKAIKNFFKHECDLSNADKKSLYYCDLINRGENINISSLLKVYSPTGLKAVLKDFINTMAKVFK